MDCKAIVPVWHQLGPKFQKIFGQKWNQNAQAQKWIFSSAMATKKYDQMSQCAVSASLF